MDGLCSPNPSIGDMNIHIRPERGKMKLKNDKTIPFSPCVTLADINRPATLLLSSAMNNAQKFHNITSEMLKSGTLKNEQTNPIVPADSACRNPLWCD
jgi:hypothetical protein